MNPFKNLVKHAWYSIRDLALPKPDFKKKEKSLVIVKTDAIGDYILFRNFIECINNSNKYQGYSITLIGNAVYKDISLALDIKWVDRFIFINSLKFQKDFSYRREILSQVEDTKYEVLFQPTYSRDYDVSEILAKRIIAERKICISGDQSNITGWQKRLSLNYYDQIIDNNKHEVFEFSKNKFVCESFLDEKLSIQKPTINLDLLPDFSVQSSNFIVFFVGGSSDFKKWDATHWFRLLKQIKKEHKIDIVLAGAPSDIRIADEIMELSESYEGLLNYCSKTSLLELMSLISKSRLVISNETSATHMAAALDIPLVVIANGSHYGRFTPYPKEIFEKYRVLLPEEIDQNKSLIELSSKYHGPSSYSINNISADLIYAKVKELLL